MSVLEVCSRVEWNEEEVVFCANYTINGTIGVIIDLANLVPQLYTVCEPIKQFLIYCVRKANSMQEIKRVPAYERHVKGLSGVCGEGRPLRSCLGQIAIRFRDICVNSCLTRYLIHSALIYRPDIQILRQCSIALQTIPIIGDRFRCFDWQPFTPIDAIIANNRLFVLRMASHSVRGRAVRRASTEL